MVSHTSRFFVFALESFLFDERVAPFRAGLQVFIRPRLDDKKTLARHQQRPGGL